MSTPCAKRGAGVIPIVKRSCPTCLYFDCSSDCEPCESCVSETELYPKWEPKSSRKNSRNTSATVTADAERTCHTCRYLTRYGDKCRDCCTADVLPNWEPWEESAASPVCPSDAVTAVYETCESCDNKPRWAKHQGFTYHRGNSYQCHTCIHKTKSQKHHSHWAPRLTEQERNDAWREERLRLHGKTEEEIKVVLEKHRGEIT